MTVGGFNQPNVARSLIELPGNAEKGLSQRFLWLFPKPVYSQFDSLEPTDKTFTDKIGEQASMHVGVNLSGPRYHYSSPHHWLYNMSPSSQPYFLFDFSSNTQQQYSKGIGYSVEEECGR